MVLARRRRVKTVGVSSHGLSKFPRERIHTARVDFVVDVQAEDSYALSFAAAIVLPVSVPVTVTRAPTLMFFAVPITQCVIES